MSRVPGRDAVPYPGSFIPSGCSSPGHHVRNKSEGGNRQGLGMLTFQLSSPTTSLEVWNY